ncbi:unnamed protein product [Symbiodinium necroappetens]|uniref:Uncharacterized protein n=1 Tax=Symbiodinium necroappetens TaxID=1628268 RepID=A0A812M298_9DINO|nr:unnamed protein product [Symbiodinium necroappetens]
MLWPVHGVHLTQSTGGPIGKVRLECMAEACEPVILGFVHLGKGIRDGGFLRETSAPGFWNCASSCNASSSCAGFLLQDRRCLLREPPPTSSYSGILADLGVDGINLAQRVTGMRARQSETAGVSMRYVLSDDFQTLATMRTGLADPSFNDMKVFWLGEDPIGRDIVCPCDGKHGCAMVDWIPKPDRRQQTHFMSWTWRYTLSEVKIILEGSVAGSANLENVLAENLTRIGQMVAILDNWRQHLRRVWTIYEQFIASTLEIPVVFTMPEASTASVRSQILLGQRGTREVTESLKCVDSASAEAWDPKDEVKVKQEIQNTVGFTHVDNHVQKVMIRWVGDAVRKEFREVIAQDSRVLNACAEMEAIDKACYFTFFALTKLRGGCAHADKNTPERAPSCAMQLSGLTLSRSQQLAVL